MTADNVTMIQQRRAAMATLNAATEAELSCAITALEPLPVVANLRPVETGLVMLRGRIGGTGQAFNVGEATVTRATVRLPDGTTGFAYRLGRAPKLAHWSAIIDALWQGKSRERIECDVLTPIRERISREKRDAAEKVAATRVEFFTLVRGED
jgi:alpha-D-ribose 1-methylphosphonate 5-triphosphate synthase subunit PhnG